MPSKQDLINAAFNGVITTGLVFMLASAIGSLPGWFR